MWNRAKAKAKTCGDIGLLEWNIGKCLTIKHCKIIFYKVIIISILNIAIIVINTIIIG